MRRFLVACRIRRCAIDLDEHEARWVIFLLNDIESDDAGLLHAVARVLQRGGGECRDVVGLHMNEHMNN